MFPIGDVDPGVLWIDLRAQQQTGQSAFDKRYQEFRYNGYRKAELFQLLEKGRFEVLIFQYDAPTSTTLRLLENVKVKHPSCPIIMLTEQHSEALAIWALRTRVWDYFVEPVDKGDIDSAVSSVLAVKASESCRRTVRGGPREIVKRISATPSNLNHRARRDLVARARAYIDHNFQRDIKLKDVAEHLRVSYSHLSRLFKQHSDCGFNECLWNARIAAAKVLLIDEDVSVTAVCYEVGCNDPGYFSTKFREATDMSPTRYQERVRKGEALCLSA